MNYLLKRDVFQLGSTTRSETKGVWVWVGPHPRDPGRTLIVLDTEGLHDIDKVGRRTDMKIFAVSLLMSSVLMYNCQGSLGADNLSDFQYPFTMSFQCIQNSLLEYSEYLIWSQIKEYTNKVLIFLRRGYSSIDPRGSTTKTDS